MDYQADLMARSSQYIEDVLFGPRRESRPQYDVIIEDVFPGFRGTWRAYFDEEQVDQQPDLDWRTRPAAYLRYVQCDFDGDRAPLRLYPEEIASIELQLVQDAIDEELESINDNR